MTVFQMVCRALRCVTYLALTPLMLSSVPYAHAAEADTDEIHTRWASAISNDNTGLLQTILSDSIQSPVNTRMPLWEVTASNGKSALMVASKVGDPMLATQLVELGADIKAKTQTDGTAFMFAVLGDQQPMAAWLMELGADINARGSNGWTSVMIAAAKGLDGTLDWLLQQGIDANTPDVYGFSPLMRATDNSHAGAVRLLLRDGDANVHWQDELDNSALHYAVSATNLNIAEQLVQADASATIKNRAGLTAIDLAQQLINETGIASAVLDERKAILALLKGAINSRD